MTNPDPSLPKGPQNRRRARRDRLGRGRLGRGRLGRGRLGIVLIAAMAMMLIIGGLGYSYLSGRGLTAPDWVTDRVEASINASVDQGRVEVGSITLSVRPDLSPHIGLRDVNLIGAEGATLLILPEVEATLSGNAFLQREFRPRALRVRGAELRLERDTDGRFNIDLGQGGGAEFTGRFADLLLALNRVLERPSLAPIERIEMLKVRVSYTDAAQGRSWDITDGHVVFSKQDDQIHAELAAPLTSDHGDEASLRLTAQAARDSASAQVAVSLTDVPARDIAAQSRALSWLDVLDAPISGWLRANTSADGVFEGLAGTLEIAAGAITPTPQSKPVPFDAGKVYFDYEPEAARLRLSEVSLKSEAVQLVGEGQAYLSELLESPAASFLGQLRLTTLKLDPEGVFDKPLSFDTGALDFRMSLGPFRLEVGQLVLTDALTRFQLMGEVVADDTGWDVAMDVTSPGMLADDVVGYWPVDAIPNTRRWMVDNVLEGRLSNVFASLRSHQGEPKRSALSFNVDDASIRFLKKLPPVTGLNGHMVIHDSTLTAVANSGQITLANGAEVGLADSVFRIPDITLKPAPAQIELRTNSSISAGLQLIDHEPLNLLKNWTKGTEFANGQARLKVDLAFPLAKTIEIEDVVHATEGSLLNVSSDSLVPGRRLTAGKLAIKADAAGLQIAGDGALDGVPIYADWRQPFGPDTGGRSRVEGHVELSQATSDTFQLGLPQGAVSGKGRADFSLDLVQSAAPKLELRSDLNRVGLNLDVLGWSKSRTLTGRLLVNATLGDVPRVNTLELSAAGLTLAGDVRFRENGGLKALNFGRLRVGDWLDVSGRLVGRGLRAPPGVEIASGQMKLAGLPSRNGGRSAESGPLDVRLARLEVTSGLALEDFRGTFTGRGGFNGDFTGNVNGGTSIRGELTPSPAGTAVRIRTPKAGEVLRDAGFFRNARDGNMELQLVPRGGKGQYSGTVQVEALRVRDAPVLASLLSAASIVGILEQLTVEGLFFSDLQASFILTPERLTVTEGSAVGPSMGISADGVFDLVSKRMDIRGVISPLYALNGIGQILTRNREGLFGFNYRMTGPVSNPRTSVNPLSILTPGIFRDLFRAAPPGAGQ